MMIKQFFMMLFSVFLAGNLFGQNCGTLSAFSYTTSASSTSGNTIYNFTISALTSSGGDKSIKLTVDVGSTTVVAAKCYISAPSTGAAFVYTDTFDVPTGTVNTTWSGHTNSICGGSTCLTGTTALPVELMGFSVKAMESHNLLLWATASELNNKGFEVERSSNGTDWQNIGWVDGFGTSNSVRNYEFLDPVKLNTTYYRLKQIDYDGKFEYSTLAVAGRKLENKIVVFPNPTSGVINFNNEIEGFKVYDAIGMLVMSSENQAKSINLSAFNKGLYLIETWAENGVTSTHRIILEY
jgi:hypothetical protein